MTYNPTIVLNIDWVLIKEWWLASGKVLCNLNTIATLHIIWTQLFVYKLHRISPVSCSQILAFSNSGYKVHCSNRFTINCNPEYFYPYCSVLVSFRIRSNQNGNNIFSHIQITINTYLIKLWLGYSS